MDEYSAATDEELWNQAIGHDGGAFGELFLRHNAAVNAHCFRRRGSASLAEELTSVAFLEAWRRRRQVQFHGDSLLPWLIGIANNSIRNSDRARRRYRKLLDKLPAAGIEADETDAVASRVDAEHLMRGLREALEALPRKEQDVLSLCDWDGLSYSEAAVALGIPIGTVRSRLVRARQRIRAAVLSNPGLSSSVITEGQRP
jgi:RNA polymerase sigma factor (sigma-70 family)